MDPLTDAGLIGITSGSTLVDVPAPLPEHVRAVVLAEFAARVDRAGRFPSERDAAAWARPLDPADPVWVGRRTDLALLTALSAYRGRAPHRV